ncbi:alpha-2,8-sialyltransferase 8E-like isoform X2 [Syngnathoides biaculeatus]|uniref:alpha-2,8-sialyltransferase 8E-like isoform X2 n=1 Tax=Syngnathoides biaculeatus TaxID=300417 RepID=UPI002ADE8652|nr:alpha-2,8-sialyltransferase 8E-like isoform X2 [Syngnathoides biaculeatus]
MAFRGASSAITLLCLCSLLSSVTWYMIDDQSALASHKPPAQRKTSPSVLCKGCRELIDKVLKRHSKKWEKNEENYRNFTSMLRRSCRGFEKAIITQSNTPVGTKIVYDAQRTKTLRVTPAIFNTFIKEHPFSSRTFSTCAVVGNGGILMDSGCGKTIDSAQFVMRCNLPPLSGEYGKHVGVRTDLVTANPTIFKDKYKSLSERRRDVVERLQSYGKSLILIPAFSFGVNTQVSLRVAYTLEDFASPSRAVFFNPDYLRNLSRFWASNGLKSPRLSTGLMMASLALEACSDVHLFGFWPFGHHPYGLYTLTNHYYDDHKANRRLHAMPVEFDLLLKLHSRGVLKLHLRRCQTSKN